MAGVYAFDLFSFEARLYRAIEMNQQSRDDSRMLYRVTGTNHGTGARMTLDLEADSRAAAERKASTAGMDVLHVQESATDGGDAVARHAKQRTVYRGGGAGGFLRLLIVIAVIAIAGWYFWAK